jgi:hypothetical protein
MFKLAAVSVGDGGEDVVSVAGGAKLNLGDAREILAENVCVLADRSSEPVEIDLLEEIEIRGGALAWAGIARVIEPGGIRIPSDTATGRASIDSGNHVLKSFPGTDVIDMHRAVFGPPFGQGDSDVVRVQRGRVEIYGGEAFRVDHVWIYDDTLGFRGEVRIEADQK